MSPTLAEKARDALAHAVDVDGVTSIDSAGFESVKKILKQPRVARFKIYWTFDHTPSATVTISRSAGTITVRPLRRRRAYTLPLHFVARLIAESVIKAEVRLKLAAKKSKRRGRR